MSGESSPGFKLPLAGGKPLVSAFTSEEAPSPEEGMCASPGAPICCDGQWPVEKLPGTLFTTVFVG